MLPLVAGRPGADGLRRRRRPPAAGRATGAADPAWPGPSTRSSSDGRDGFYLGEFGDGLLALGGGEYTADDLARPQADWVDAARPAGVGRRRVDDATELAGLPHAARPRSSPRASTCPTDPDDPRWAHLLVESARQAGADRPDRAARAAPTPTSCSTRGRARRPPGRASTPTAPARCAHPAADGGTIYLCAVDGDRMGVSLIQSNASGFGSLLFEPSTGINLHNRGIGFSLEPGHPARYGPGRRPPHTLSPALVTRPDGSLRAVLGSMGGDAQPQIVLQLLARLLQAGQTPAQAVQSPRFVLANHGGAHRLRHLARPGPGRRRRRGRRARGWMPGPEPSGASPCRRSSRRTTAWATPT